MLNDFGILSGACRFICVISNTSTVRRCSSPSYAIKISLMAKYTSLTVEGTFFSAKSNSSTTSTCMYWLPAQILYLYSSGLIATKNLVLNPIGVRIRYARLYGGYKACLTLSVATSSIVAVWSEAAILVGSI